MSVTDLPKAIDLREANPKKDMPALFNPITKSETLRAICAERLAFLA